MDIYETIRLANSLLLRALFSVLQKMRLDGWLEKIFCRSSLISNLTSNSILDSSTTPAAFRNFHIYIYIYDVPLLILVQLSKY